MKVKHSITTLNQLSQHLFHQIWMKKSEVIWEGERLVLQIILFI
ncbi:hypothetical protein HanRHA438_Chr08g0363721 [Helianthus annuus]|nr:hypothetical protein HanRHA438_Chr08g0363721 [Helianthus annuus]